MTDADTAQRHMTTLDLLGACAVLCVLMGMGSWDCAGTEECGLFGSVGGIRGESMADSTRPIRDYMGLRGEGDRETPPVPPPLVLLFSPTLPFPLLTGLPFTPSKDERRGKTVNPGKGALPSIRKG